MFYCYDCGEYFERPGVHEWLEDMNGEGAYQRHVALLCPCCGGDDVTEKEKPMQIDFDPERHEYRVDGVLVPSVTALVAPLGADCDDPDDFGELTIEAAAERGTAMHGYLEHRLRGGDPDDYELPDSYSGYADAVDLFLAEHTLEPYAIETPMGCETFAGTPDYVGAFDGDDCAVLDWKFVSQLAKTKVSAQLAGYRELCETVGLFPDSLYAVQFLKTGEYRLYPVRGAGGLDAFRVCQKLYDLKKKKHPRGAIA